MSINSLIVRCGSTLAPTYSLVSAEVSSRNSTICGLYGVENLYKSN